MPIREQQTTNKQHAIPQSIMSVQFKIIGDLTIKQFFFLMIFCGMAYVSFMTIPIFLIKWSLVTIFVVTGLAFAFLPLGDRGLDAWVTNFLKAMFMPNQYVYRKEEEIPNVFLYQNLDVLKSELITLTPTSSRRKIEAYLEQQQAPEDKLDIDEKTYILKVKQAYASEAYVGIRTEETVVVVPPVAAPVVTPSPPQTTTSVITDSRGYQIPEQVITPKETPPSVLVSAAETTITPSAPPSAPIVEEPIINTSQKVAPPAQPGLPKRKHHRNQESDYYSPSMTPDMHSGRRFINLSQEAARGEIILPIRGERVLGPDNEKKFDSEEARKVKELDNLISQIKSKELVQRQILESQRIQENEEARRKRLADAKQATELAEAQKVEKAEEEARKLREQEESLRKQKEELIKKQQEEEEAKLKTIQTQGVALPPRPQTQTQAIPLEPAQIQDRPEVPNIVWGLITAPYGGNKVPVPGVVVIVRNNKNEVVRAVKSNSQGRFAITTPLINGSYTIEVDKEKRSGLKFAITAIEASGKIIPVMEIVGEA